MGSKSSLCGEFIDFILCKTENMCSISCHRTGGSINQRFCLSLKGFCVIYDLKKEKGWHMVDTADGGGGRLGKWGLCEESW